MLRSGGLRAFRGQKIGLLGGSFNPPHEGHMHIIKLAIKHLGLNNLWCLVSPQNPLKSVREMAPLKRRIREARRVLKWPFVTVSDIEAELLTRYSVDTIKSLIKKYPGVKFVWIMGADNLVQINRWQGWEQIFKLVPVAVFDRPPYSLLAENSVASKKFARHRVSPSQAKSLPKMKPPGWVYLKTPLNSVSATELRQSTASKF